jgi:hypothetical protein
MAAASLPGWLQRVTLADLALAGIAPDEGDERQPSVFLLEWAADYAVDLSHVSACLAVLASTPSVLHVGAPLGMLAFSPRRQRFRASFDTACPEDLVDLRLPTAAAWLTVLASEAGALPARESDRQIVRITSAGICGNDQAAVDLYRQYASIVTRQPRPGLAADGISTYDVLAARAFWCCASYALR